MIKKKVWNLMQKSRLIMADRSGQGAFDQLLQILISIILGAMLLTGLYAIFGDVVLPEIQRKVMELFSYAG